jgi:toxin YoeB
MTCSMPTEHAAGLGHQRLGRQPVVAGSDRKVLKRINLLIQDVMRNGNEGIGKPEPLKHDVAGYWSRRITDEHRLVYKVTDDEIRIAACRYHYGR